MWKHFIVWPPIWYETLHVRDRRSAPSLRHRNRAAITVLMCEHKPYPVRLSCRRKNYPYSVKIAFVKGVQGIYFAFLIWDSGTLTVAAMSLLWTFHGSFNKSKCLCNIKYRRQLYGARLCSPFKSSPEIFWRTNPHTRLMNRLACVADMT